MTGVRQTGYITAISQMLAGVMLESWHNGNNFPYRHVRALNFSLQCIISSSDPLQTLVQHIPVDTIPGSWVPCVPLGRTSARTALSYPWLHKGCQTKWRHAQRPLPHCSRLFEIWHPGLKQKTPVFFFVFWEWALEGCHRQAVKSNQGLWAEW